MSSDVAILNMETDYATTSKNVTTTSKPIWSKNNKNSNNKSHMSNNISAQENQKKLFKHLSQTAR